jgi:CRP-like cAMP-binding protein
MQLLAIPRASFEEMMRQPAFVRAMMRLLTRRLRLTNARLLSLASQDVTGRVAQQLAVLAREYHAGEEGSPIAIPLRLTQGDLAALIGATRQSVNRVLVDLTRRSYISTDRDHRVTVHQLAALERLSRR